MPTRVPIVSAVAADVRPRVIFFLTKVFLLAMDPCTLVSATVFSFLTLGLMSAQTLGEPKASAAAGAPVHGPLTIEGQILAVDPATSVNITPTGMISIYANPDYQNGQGQITIQAASYPNQNFWSLKVRDIYEGDFSIFDVVHQKNAILIDPADRVGVGVTDPQTALDVSGAIRSRSGGVVFPDGTSQATAALRGPAGPQGVAGPQGPPGPSLQFVGGSGITVTQNGNIVTISLSNSGVGGSPGSLTVNVENMTGSGSISVSASNGASATCSTGLPGKAVSCPYTFPVGTVVTLTPHPTSTFGFSEQFGNCGTVTIGTTPQTCGVEFFNGN